MDQQSMVVIDKKPSIGVVEEAKNIFPLNDHVSKDGAEEENIGIQLPEIDSVAEKKLVRKLDMHLVPVVMLLYLLSYLDRINIGNARFGKTHFSSSAILGLPLPRSRTCHYPCH
jgi:hypothetical protein